MSLYIQNYMDRFVTYLMSGADSANQIEEFARTISRIEDNRAQVASSKHSLDLYDLSEFCAQMYGAKEYLSTLCPVYICQYDLIARDEIIAHDEIIARSVRAKKTLQNIARWLWIYSREYKRANGSVSRIMLYLSDPNERDKWIAHVARGFAQYMQGDACA